MGYAIRFTVPAGWWLTCTGSESVSERARIRHRLREYGKRVWRDILAQGALRVDRFMLPSWSPDARKARYWRWRR